MMIYIDLFVTNLGQCFETSERKDTVIIIMNK